MAKKSTPGDGSHGRGVKGGRSGPYDTEGDKGRALLDVVKAFFSFRRLVHAKDL